MNKELTNEQQIIDYAFEELVNDKSEYGLPFSELLELVMKKHDIKTISDKSCFKLYSSFIKKYKNNIYLKSSCNGPSGLPYDTVLIKYDHNEVKKIVYNFSHSSWGVLEKMSRMCVIFEREKITFCSIPLLGEGTITNCKVTISYNPLSDSFSDDEYRTNEYNFDYLVHSISSIKTSKEPMLICDAEAASIVIHYKNKKKRVLNNLLMTNSHPIIKAWKKYFPKNFNSDDLLDF